MKQCPYCKSVWTWDNSDEKIAALTEENARLNSELEHHTLMSYANPLQLNFGTGLFRVNAFKDETGYGVIFKDTGEQHSIGPVDEADLDEEHHQPERDEVYLHFTNKESLLVVVECLLWSGELESIEELKTEITRLRKLSVHCPDCGGDYAQTGLEVGCSCKLKAENKRLREVLAWYGNEENYRLKQFNGVSISDLIHEKPIIEDGGQRARTELERKG